MERERNFDGSVYGIDLDSTEVQKMSDEKTTHAVLQETVYGWLKGTTMYMFSPELRTMVYADFANHIGCDASEYYFSTRDNARVYTWYAADKPIAGFAVYFRQNDGGEWNVFASGASQVKMPDDFIKNLKTDGIGF